MFLSLITLPIGSVLYRPKIQMTYCWGGGASGNVNILMFNRTLVDNANRDTSNNRSFFEYYGVIHI